MKIPMHPKQVNLISVPRPSVTLIGYLWFVREVKQKKLSPKYIKMDINRAFDRNNTQKLFQFTFLVRLYARYFE